MNRVIDLTRWPIELLQLRRHEFEQNQPHLNEDGKFLLEQILLEIETREKMHDKVS
jgi:hypothetical protein